MNAFYSLSRRERRKTREREAKETEEESETIVEPPADRVATESSRRPSASASSRILGRIPGGPSDIFIRAFANKSGISPGSPIPSKMFTKRPAVPRLLLRARAYRPLNMLVHGSLERRTSRIPRREFHREL